MNKMSVEILIEMLSKQSKNLKNLLTNAVKKQEALVEHNRDLLDECIRDEQKLILAVQNSEKGRLKFISNINIENGFEENEYRLTKLTNNLREVLSEDAKAALIKSERSIRTFIDDITKVNNQNLFLIQHSRQFIDSTLKSVFNGSKRSILDRKV